MSTELLQSKTLRSIQATVCCLRASPFKLPITFRVYPMKKGQLTLKWSLQVLAKLDQLRKYAAYDGQSMKNLAKGMLGPC